MVRFLERYPCSEKEANINKSSFYPLDIFMSESGTQNCGSYFRFTKGTKAGLEDGEVEWT